MNQMEVSCSYERTITPSICDYDGRLSVPDCFGLFMDAAAIHAAELGVGIADMSRRGLFWLTVRTKVHFLRRPQMLERVTVWTRPIEPEKVRSIREYRLTKDGELLAEGKTEWTVVETPAGKIHPMQDVFPESVEMASAPAFAEPFCRIGPGFRAEEGFGSYTVRSSDIDVGGHMNNVAYLHALFGMLSAAERKSLPQNTVEIAFRAPCFEGETLSCFRRAAEQSAEFAMVKPDGTVGVLVKVS